LPLVQREDIMWFQYKAPLLPLLVAAPLVLSPWAPEAVAGTRISTLVLDLVSHQVPKAELEVLSEELRAELATFHQLAVISKRDVDRLLDVTQQQQMLGCDTTSCLAEVAGALGAERIVSGSVGSVGSQKLVQLQLIDTSRAVVIRRVSYRVTEASLVDGVRAAARKLMQVAGVLHLVNQVTGADVFVAGRKVGVMPLKPFPVPESGDVELRVEHVDYLPYTHMVTITPGKTTRHMLHMQKYAEVQSSAQMRTYWAYGVGGLGAAFLSASVVFFVNASEAYDTYKNLDPRRADKREFYRWEKRTKDQITLGSVACGLGTALLGLGMYLYLENPYLEVLLQEEEGASATLLPTSGGIVAAFRGVF